MCRYRGYCPQIKYRVGKTYGTDTNQLSEKTDHVHPLPPVGLSNPKPVLSNRLPTATGDNKYTEQMVPGYTGNWPLAVILLRHVWVLSFDIYICFSWRYSMMHLVLVFFVRVLLHQFFILLFKIRNNKNNFLMWSFAWIISGYIPRSPFKFGNTYKEDCDFNIDQHLSMYKYHDYKMRDLQNHVKTASQLHPVSRDPHVKNVLDKYRDTHPTRSILLGKYCIVEWILTRDFLYIVS